MGATRALRVMLVEDHAAFRQALARLLAYEHFKERGPQYVDAESGLRASAYRFGERVLLVYEESETGLVVLSKPSA